MKGILAFLVLALMLVPATQAAHLQDVLFGEGNQGETIRYQIRDITNTSTGGFTSSFDNFKLHSYELAPGGTVMRINVQATYSIVLANDGRWLFELFVDGSAVEDCNFLLPTRNPGGFLAGDLPVYPSYDVECTLPPSITGAWEEDENISVEWVRSIESGAPDQPDTSVVSIVFDREDFILTHSETAFEELTGLSGPEFLVFIAVIGLTILLWSKSKDEVVQLFSGCLLILFGVIGIGLRDEWSAWIAFGAVMAIVGSYLVVRSGIDWFSED